MEMDWTCAAYATNITAKGSPQVDSRRCRNRGRPKETWRRTVETEMKKQGWAWVTWRDVLQTDHAGGLRWRPHALPSVERIKRREE